MAKPKPHEKHRQCKLRKGARVTYSWLPAKYATAGSYVELKDADGVWENGWLVEETWAEHPSRDVLARSNLWKDHRKGTDAYRDGDDGWETPHGRRAPVS